MKLAAANLRNTLNLRKDNPAIRVLQMEIFAVEFT
jgi:hypothetical protein